MVFWLKAEDEVFKKISHNTCSILKKSTSKKAFFNVNLRDKVCVIDKNTQKNLKIVKVLKKLYASCWLEREKTRFYMCR